MPTIISNNKIHSGNPSARWWTPPKRSIFTVFSNFLDHQPASSLSTHSFFFLIHIHIFPERYQVTTHTSLACLQGLIRKLSARESKEGVCRDGNGESGKRGGAGNPLWQLSGSLEKLWWDGSPNPTGGASPVSSPCWKLSLSPRCSSLALKPGTPKRAPQSPSEPSKHRSANRKASPERQQSHTPSVGQVPGAGNFIPWNKRKPQEGKRRRRRTVKGANLTPYLPLPLPPPPLTPGEGPGAAHLLARRKRAAGGGQVSSPGRLAAGERPAAQPGGAPGQREPAAGSPWQPPAPPARRRPSAGQHLCPCRQKGSLPGWARSGSRAARAARSTRRSLAPCPSARWQLRGARGRGSWRRCSRHAGGRDRGARARRGGGTQGGDAGAGEQVARAGAVAQPSGSWGASRRPEAGASLRCRGWERPVSFGSVSDPQAPWPTRRGAPGMKPEWNTGQQDNVFRRRVFKISLLPV